MKFRALLAEFVGTFSLIFVGVLVIHNLDVPAGLIGIALGHGLAIACLASATGAISGGHLNPAVTFGLLLAKRIDPLNALGYWIAQCVGAIVAGYAAAFVSTTGSGDTIASLGTPALGTGISSVQGIIAEAIATFFLVFVVLGTAVDRRAPKMGALFIGLTVTMGILAIGPLTGGALNPARWIGSGVPGSNLSHPEVYIVGPLLGAAVASLLYVLFLEDKTPLAPGDPVRVDPQG
jgi:aquaporin TIP